MDIVEHIIAAVSPSDYKLSYEAFAPVRLFKALTVRGITGGCLIFHGFRYANFAGVKKA